MRKYIITVIVGDDQADEVETAVQEVADALNARLTRSDWKPARAPGTYTKERSKTLHKQGRLA